MNRNLFSLKIKFGFVHIANNGHSINLIRSRIIRSNDNFPWHVYVRRIIFFSNIHLFLLPSKSFRDRKIHHTPFREPKKEDAGCFLSFDTGRTHFFVCWPRSCLDGVQMCVGANDVQVKVCCMPVGCCCMRFVRSQRYAGKKEKEMFGKDFSSFFCCFGIFLML